MTQSDFSQSEYCRQPINMTNNYIKQQQKVLNNFYFIIFILVQYCKVHGDMLLFLDWQIFCLPVSKFTMWIFVSTVNRVWQGHIVSQSACVGDEISLHSSHSLAQVKTIHSQCIHIRHCVPLNWIDCNYRTIRIECLNVYIWLLPNLCC